MWKYFYQVCVHTTGGGGGLGKIEVCTSRATPSLVEDALWIRWYPQ